MRVPDCGGGLSPAAFGPFGVAGQEVAGGLSGACGGGVGGDKGGGDDGLDWRGGNGAGMSSWVLVVNWSSSLMGL